MSHADKKNALVADRAATSRSNVSDTTCMRDSDHPQRCDQPCPAHRCVCLLHVVLDI